MPARLWREGSQAVVLKTIICLRYPDIHRDCKLLSLGEAESLSMTWCGGRMKKTEEQSLG